MTYYMLVFITYAFIGDPINGDVRITDVSKIPYSFVDKEECEKAFKQIRAQNLTTRYAHTCAPVIDDQT
jgi:hypothetical protein